VTLYDGGRGAYAAMLEAVEGARGSVNLETYIFNDDGVGRRFAEALARKAGEGVVVNLTVDAAGCWHTPDAFFEDLEARGVRVLVYNPIRPWRVRHGRWVLNRRDHRKILVVDGRVGFTGGMNIGDEYDGDAGAPGRWKDTHVRVEGPAVKYLQRAFMGMRWRKEGDAVAEADYFPPLREDGPHAVRVLPTTPLLGRPYVRIVLRRAIHAARRTVHATQSYFLPDARVLWSLRAAARRGVEIGLVVPSVSDVPLALHAGRSTYGRLLRSGVSLHEFQGLILHQKTVIVDGEWSILGSANMDIRSFRINHEISLDVLGRDFAERLEDAFRRDLALSRPVDPVAWARRPLLAKLRQRLAGALRSVLG
jgi:cardiolipin synthase